MHWTSRISPDTAAHLVRRALAEGRLGESAPALIAHDLGLMRARLAALQAAFPPSALHAVAIKANPLLEVLKRLVSAGAGLEAASIGEVKLALAAGCQPDHIVFDSPAKTPHELQEALALGLRINADNMEELARLAAIMPHVETTSRIGLRINPLVGEGEIAMTSVSGQASKFGTSLAEREAILEAFARHPWLTGLHVHVGSQGCPLPMLLEAAGRMTALMAEINQQAGHRQVRTLDLGGGLPARYDDAAETPTLEAYVAGLQEAAPAAFDPALELVTEFGRAIQANCGWAVSRVEYVKRAGETRLAVLHLGADFMLRTAYRPADWPHQFAVLDAEGRLKAGPETPWTLAGPLCFSGDMLGTGVPLPAIAAGDWVLLRDVGAYTLGMWSRYCSRPIPAVVGYDDPEGPLITLREAETPDDLVAFWSGPRI